MNLNIEKKENKEEEEKIKEEAKYLIEKTKKMINNMNINKKRNMKNINNNTETFTPKTFISTDIPRFDSPKLSPSRYNNSLPFSDNLINDYSKVNYTKSNNNISKADVKIMNMNNNRKINELNKYIKELEKELKLKNEIISSLEKKLFNNSDNIKELNNIITNERNDDLKVENSKLKRKIILLEKTINENTFMYEEIIKEYKNKINENNIDLNNNVSVINNLKNNFDELLKNYDNTNNELNERKKDFENANLINKKFEIREKNYINRIENLENNFRVVLNYLRNLYQQEKINYPKRTEIYEKLNFILNNNNNNNNIK